MQCDIKTKQSDNCRNLKNVGQGNFKSLKGSTEKNLKVHQEVDPQFYLIHNQM